MTTKDAKFIRSFISSDLSEIPKSARFYKQVGGKKIYKDILTDKFWIVEPRTFSFYVEEWRGKCPC